MFGFGPCNLKKNSKNCRFVASCNQCFALQIAITSFSKVSIQVDPKFNEPLTPYIESMLLYWRRSLVHSSYYFQPSTIESLEYQW